MIISYDLIIKKTEGRTWKAWKLRTQALELDFVCLSTCYVILGKLFNLLSFPICKWKLEQCLLLRIVAKTKRDNVYKMIWT